MDNTAPVKIMLVDDHPIVLNGLKTLLNEVEDIQIVAEATNGKDALSVMEDNPVDVIITDISMPEMDGIELTKVVKEKFPDIRVLILTAHNEKEILKKVLSSGAEACLLKNSSKKELLHAIHKIKDDGYYYCDDLLAIASSIHKEPESVAKEPIAISSRELEVLELILQGYSNKEVADKLCISYHTVCSHRKNIMKKTGSVNISGLFNYSRKYRLFPLLFENKND